MAAAVRGLDELAGLVLEVAPLLMRSIRAEMRTHRGQELSVPQFRILNYVHLAVAVSLSEVAEHMGLTLPSASKAIDALVARRLVVRTQDTKDRRRVVIALTPLGQSAWESSRALTRAWIVGRLKRTTDADRAAIERAMIALRTAVAGDETEDGTRQQEIDHVGT